jgi:hypothetical protein
MSLFDTPFDSTREAALWMKCESVGAIAHILSTSSLRTQGPITTGRGVVRKSLNSVSHNRRHGVWVPAFAGTTASLCVAINAAVG